MNWRKLGLVFRPDGSRPWAANSALTPTPIMLDDDTIRVFAGFRDNEGVSRIGYVDLNAADPREVMGVSSEPVLDIGRDGAFDDNGVILGDIIRVGSEMRMYYVGFQLVKKAKFLAFTGLAVSSDNGGSFTRFSEAPILDRSSNGLYIRAIHSVMEEHGRFRIWYACGNGWQNIGETCYPQYNIRCIESADGLNFSGEGELCIDVSGTEYRIGRPRVFRRHNGYVMHYTKGTVEGEYLAGYAESKNGTDWVRLDHKLGLSLSDEGWDSRHLAYPAVVRTRYGTYLFYNGNDMGREGFGCAVLAGESHAG